jgi:ectoine hydroxylase-related dioxygenase (phytanoyl-CoA dioxygenase family)
MKFDPHFYRFFEDPRLLALVDALLTPSATLRFQNVGVIQPGPNAFRPGPWHMNFRPGVRGYRAAIEIGFAIDQIDEGMYEFALGSHQRPRRPDDQGLQTLARTFAIEAGTMIVFDSTLWHREGEAEAEQERRLVNHQFVRHFIKPHIDLVRALGEPAKQALPERTRRLLGWESRVPASLEEFYRPAATRLYQPGQD